MFLVVSTIENNGSINILICVVWYICQELLGSTLWVELLGCGVGMCVFNLTGIFKLLSKVDVLIYLSDISE